MNRQCVLAVLSVWLVFMSVSTHALFSNNDSAEYTKTKYPIVLVHGMLGFDHTRILGMLPMDYWPHIPYELIRSGARAYVLQVSSVNTAPIRGEQVIRQLETLQAITGDEKFNLIGHSLGAPTIRYAAGIRPDLIASVTGVGGSNDTNERDVDEPVLFVGDTACDLQCKVYTLLAKLGGVFSGKTLCTNDVYSKHAATREAAMTSCAAVLSEINESSLPFDAAVQEEFFSTLESFNRTFSEGRPSEWCGEGSEVGSDNIGYYSWSGTQLFTNFLDVTDPVMGLLGADDVKAGRQTDGMVPRCRSHWGKVIRSDYPMNHLDETNLIWGLTKPFFSETGLYRQHANRLKNKGY